MRRPLLLACALSCALTQAAFGQLWVKQTGVDNSNPASSSNPYPVTLAGSGSGTSNVNITKVNSDTPSATNPLSTQLTNGTNNIDTTHPLAAQLSQGSAALSATNGIYANVLNANVAPSASNPFAVRVSADGTNYIDATHGIYADLLQGNAVISATNPLFTNISVGSAAVSTTNALPVAPNGVAQASIVNVTAAIANIDTTIAFGITATHAIIKTDSGASNIFVDLANGTATTADFKIDGGGALTYTGAGITGFHYIGSSASGNISYLAW